MKEKEIKKLEECILNIEQLGADSRYSLDFESWGALYVKLNSIEYWAKKGKKLVEKLVEKFQQEEQGNE